MPLTPKGASPQAALERRVGELESTVEALEGRVETLSAAVKRFMEDRPGRKAIPLVAVNQPGVCAIDPERDDKKCPDASTYRYQQGCRGARCATVNRDYYTNKRRQAEQAEKAPAKKPAAKKAAPKAPAAQKAPAPKKAPAKKAPPRKAR